MLVLVELAMLAKHTGNHVLAKRVGNPILVELTVV